MTDYGATGNFISISTGIAGSYPQRYPTGEKIYLWVGDFGGERTNKDKGKEMGNNVNYNNRMGKMARPLHLRKCIMIDDDGEATTNTASFNLKITRLDAWCGINAAAVYVIITPKVDNPAFVQPNTSRVVNLALSRKGRNTPLDYLKCALKSVPWKAIGGHYEIDINFRETNLR